MYLFKKDKYYKMIHEKAVNLFNGKLAYMMKNCKWFNNTYVILQ